jgi:arginase family enzyme
MYKVIYKDIINNVVPEDRQLLYMSTDSAVASSVITGLSRRYMYSYNDKADVTHFRSKLNIIYVDSKPDINILDNDGLRDFVDFNAGVVSNATSFFEPTYTNHELTVQPDKFYMIGLDKESTSDADKDKLRQYKFNHHYIQDLRKRGIKSIVDSIVGTCNDTLDPVMINIDLSCLQRDFCPSTLRTEVEGGNRFTLSELRELLMSFKELLNVVAVVITGYDFSFKVYHDITPENIEKFNTLSTIVIKDIITSITNLKEKTINIFNSDSYFLIWRRIDPPPKPGTSIHDEDYGWYILRNCPLDVREQIISTKLVDDDTIITESMLDDDGEPMDVMITKTTMNEQEKKTYFGGGTYLDCILYPEEKAAMMFELLNTPQLKLNKEESDVSAIVPPIDESVIEKRKDIDIEESIAEE